MIETIGSKIDDIPVTISYRIIELFSAGLYSSPNKAFEELVTNSYDANATNVSVYVPTDKAIEGSIMWVCDNGTSMDKEELKLFWKIGESQKKDIVDVERMPIGKFGIGKLSTYILAKKLTVICKAKDGHYYAVLMNYNDINSSTEHLSLDEKELSEEETKKLLAPMVTKNGQNMLSFDLWGDKAETTWTMVIMSDLKPKAQEIKEGRLKWILKTALPLNPQFVLHYNGTILESSKAAIEPWKTWVFGDDNDVVVKKHDLYSSYSKKDTFYVDLPNLKGICGHMDLYRDSLVSGKSEQAGRSNGIFLTVRKRLINIDDPLLGMEALTHGVFNRIRIMVEADGLNDYLTSTRESIKASDALEDLRTYIKRKFSEVREWYFKEIEEETKKNLASYKIAYAPYSLSRQPLAVVAKKYCNGELQNLYLTEMPQLKNEKEKQDFLSDLESRLTSEDGIINKVEWCSLTPQEPIAKLDIASGFARVNLMHPFFANFIDEVKSLLPFQLFALTEILTECVLLESGINQEDVKDIMHNRDLLLRELTYSDKPNAPLVAQLLSDTVSESAGLESSVFKAFNSLGFETTPIGGNGKPDGLAIAYIGPKDSADNYSITYDAKSTAKDRIKAITAHVSGVLRHKTDYSADYACVVAVDFEGSEDENSAVNKEAKQNKINLIRVRDLAKLVLLSSPKQVGLNELKDLFENCHTVRETSAWIDALQLKEVSIGPIKELLTSAYKMNKEDTEPASIQALRYYDPTLKNFSIEDLKTLIQSIERLVPNYVHLTGDILNLNTTPDKIMETINKAYTSNVPTEFMQMYIDSFGESEKK